MEVKLFAVVSYLLVLGTVSSQDVKYVPHSRRDSGLLQQAIKYLVNYTAAEAEASLDMNNIGSTVAAIAYQEFTEKLGRKMYQ